MTRSRKAERQPPRSTDGDIIAKQAGVNHVKPKKPTANTDETQLPTVPGDGVGVAPALCAGAQTSPEHDPIGKYQIAISTGWQKAAQTILGVCKLCAEAHGILDADSRHDLIGRLPFDRTVFSKLVAIGNSPALTNPEVETALPPNWTILDLARKLTPAELDQAISRGVISPNSSRAEVKRWISDPENTVYAKARPRREAAAAVSSAQDRELQALLAAWKSSPLVIEKWRQASEPLRHRFWLAIKEA